jgi:hypothetical protein
MLPRYQCVINLILITISYSKEELEVIIVNSPPVATPNSLQVSTPSSTEPLTTLVSHGLKHMAT